jgi:DNA gyrase subunit A
MVMANYPLVKSGKVVRFEETKTRPMGTASGVRGISLKMILTEVMV